MASARLLALVAVAVLLLGCISLSYVQKLEKNGSSELSFNLNLTKLMGMTALGSSFGNVSSAMNNTAQMEAQVREFCENRSKTDSSMTCSYADKTLTVSRHYSSVDGAYKFSAENFSGDDFRGTRYTFTLERLPNMTEELNSAMAKKEVSGQGMTVSTGEIGLDFTDPRAKEEAAKASLVMSIKYVVEMPGAIVSAEGADSFRSGRAVFDVLKMMKAGKNIVVISEEKEFVALEQNIAGGAPQPVGAAQDAQPTAQSLEQNIGLPEGDWITCAGAAVLSLVAVLVLMMGLLNILGSSVPRRHRDTKEERQAKLRLADYVKKQLEAGKTPEDLRKELIEKGWASEDVDNAIKVATWYGGPLGMY